MLLLNFHQKLLDYVNIGDSTLVFSIPAEDVAELFNDIKATYQHIADLEAEVAKHREVAV